jgi:ribokinase
VTLVQLEIPLPTIEKVLGLSNKSGVILNPAPATNLPEEFFRWVYVLTPNTAEAKLLSGIEVEDIDSCRKAAEYFFKMGVKNVVITLGCRGAFYATESKYEVVAPLNIKAVDTTACGDAFNGALAVALAIGKEMKDAIRFATVAGALTATRWGAQPSLPFIEEVERFL